jgi:HSP20 family protein
MKSRRISFSDPLSRILFSFRLRILSSSFAIIKTNFMIFTMKHTFFLAIALASMASAANSWSFERMPYGILSPMVQHAYSPAERLLRQSYAPTNRELADFSSYPRCEVTDNDEKFELAIAVPGIDSKNIDVSVNDNILSIQGHQESKSGTYSFTSTFSQSYTLDPTVESDKVNANLNNGILVISAPKDLEKLGRRVRNIPILTDSSSLVQSGEQTSDVAQDHKEIKIATNDDTK